MKNRKEKMVDELCTEIETIEKDKEKYEQLVLKVQDKLFGIESVMMCMTRGSINEQIPAINFRVGMEVVLDSISAVLKSIGEVL